MAFLPISLVKMSGAGNTFVLVDATKTSTWNGIEQKLKIKRRPFVQTVCDRILGVSADGVLFLEDDAGENSYKWDFYNADGSSAEMCGNAARCAAVFAGKYLSSSVSGIYQFSTGAGKVSAQVLGDDSVRVMMPEVREHREKQILDIDGVPVEFSFVNSGVPHLVKSISNYGEAADLKNLAKKARSHKDLGPAGANVTFSFKEKEGVLKAVTFERGVEDFTQACGTGAVAAAYIEHHRSQNKNIDVHMPGGVLKIHFSETTKHPLMTGQAVFVIEFQYFYEVMG